MKNTERPVIVLPVAFMVTAFVSIWWIKMVKKFFVIHFEVEDELDEIEQEDFEQAIGDAMDNHNHSVLDSCVAFWSEDTK